MSKVAKLGVSTAVLLLVAATMLTAAPQAVAQPDATVIRPDVVRALGVTRPTGMTPADASLAVASAVKSSSMRGGPLVPQPLGGAGLPQNMLNTAPFSASVITTVGAPFFQVSLMGDWDGTEDLVADHQGT